MKMNHKRLRRCYRALWLAPFLMLGMLAGCDAPSQPPTVVNIPPETGGREVDRGSSEVVFDVGDVQMHCSLYVPEGYDQTKPAALVVGLHFGYRGTKPPKGIGKGMSQMFLEPSLMGINDRNVIIAAPTCLGGGWTTEENESAVVAMTRELMETYAVDPDKVVIAGFSMGGAGVWHIGGQHQDLFKFGVAVSARPVAPEKWKNPLLVIHSRADEVAPIGPVEKAVSKMKENAQPVKGVFVDDISHFVTPDFVPVTRESSNAWFNEKWRK